MSRDEQAAVIMTDLALALDAQAPSLRYPTAQQRGWAGGLWTPKPRRHQSELLQEAWRRNGDPELLQYVSDCLDTATCEWLDDDPEVEAFSDLDPEWDAEPLREIVEQTLSELDYERAECRFCERPIPLVTAHRHQDEWVGDCCWDERLCGSE